MPSKITSLYDCLITDNDAIAVLIKIAFLTRQTRPTDSALNSSNEKRNAHQILKF
jgi:hypothetical protein